jgi:sec-independent protein translocase protein TatB
VLAIFNSLGGGELIAILVIALIVLGPEKLPEAIRKFGNIYGELRRMSQGFQSELRDAFDEPLQELRGTAKMMQDAINDPIGAASGMVAVDEPPPAAEPEERQAPVEEDAAAPEGESASVEGEPASVEGESASVEGEPAPVEGEPAPVGVPEEATAPVDDADGDEEPVAPDDAAAVDQGPGG